MKLPIFEHFRPTQFLMIQSNTFLNMQDVSSFSWFLKCISTGTCKCHTSSWRYSICHTEMREAFYFGTKHGIPKDRCCLDVINWHNIKPSSAYCFSSRTQEAKFLAILRRLPRCSYLVLYPLTLLLLSVRYEKDW